MMKRINRGVCRRPWAQLCLTMRVNILEAVLQTRLVAFGALDVGTTFLPRTTPCLLRNHLPANIDAAVMMAMKARERARWVMYPGGSGATTMATTPKVEPSMVMLNV